MNRFVSLSLIGAGLTFSTAQAQIEITPNLSVTGFIDMSATHIDGDGFEETLYGLDQVELDFLLTVADPLTAQFDFNYLNDTDVELEQGFITWAWGNGWSMNAGKFLSYHGWEAAEPTGLWQYSYAYELVGSIPGYNNGISFDYTSDMFTFGFSLLDAVYADDSEITDSEFGFELKFVAMPTDGLTLYAGYANDNYDPTFMGDLDSIELFNFWGSYEYESFTFAGEVNFYTESYSGVADLDATQWLLMMNYAIDDKTAVTFRYSGEDVDFSGVDDDTTKLTISPSYAFNDNLLGLLEISAIDTDSGGDATFFAIEALFTY